MDKIKDFIHSDKSIGMDNLKLKYISEKDDNYYFEVTNPDEFVKNIIMKIKAKHTFRCLEVEVVAIFY